MTTMKQELAGMINDVFGQDVWDDSAEATADRIIRFWAEYVPPKHLPFKVTTFPADAIGDQLIMASNIEFSSICAHHLLPFIGIAHVAYIPHELMIGLSKLPRIVDYFASRPQVQERLTSQIADYIKDVTSAKGVAVLLEARHTCMACRGVRKHNGTMVTSQVKGVFLTAPAARAEFFAAINVNGGRI